jgi:hypothetical protein
VGPTETAVQDALDRALENSPMSAMARVGMAGRADDDREVLRYALELLTGLTEAVKVLATAVDDLRVLVDEFSS